MFALFLLRVAIATTTTQFIPRSPEHRGHKENRKRSLRNLILGGRAHHPARSLPVPHAWRDFLSSDISIPSYL